MNEKDDAQITEEIQHAQNVQEPGMAGLKEGIREAGMDMPDEGKPRIKWLTSAGYVYVWDNRTGDRSIINRNMLPAQLNKRRPDGSRIFTTVDPHILVKGGNLKCMLHTDDENRKHYDELGLATCKKHNLTSPYQVRRHMQKRHPQEWATIQDEITAREKEEDRALRRAVLTATGKAKAPEEEPPLYEAPKKRKK